MTLEPIVSALSVIAGALGAGLLNILAQRQAQEKERFLHENENLKQKVKRLAEQLEAYQVLEVLYSDELSVIQKKSAKRILIEFRDKTEERNDVRPGSITPSKLRSIVESVSDFKEKK
jgi:hypothetical protein